MKKLHLLLLSLLSGILLSAAWPAGGWPGLLFIALVPLLLIEDHIDKNRGQFHRYSIISYVYPAFFLWNLLTTYWIWNSTEVGAILAIVFNAFFMSAVFALYHLSKRLMYTNQGYFILIFYWISWEFLHHNWDLNWPWLDLGNGFASYYKWIQWYEYTGVFGGSFWVLLTNIILYQGLKNYLGSGKFNRKVKAWLIAGLLIILLPVSISYIIYCNYEEKVNPVEVVVVQPNFDPYTEQYSVPPGEVIKRNLDLARQKMDGNTSFIVCPESAIQERIWERKLEYSSSLRQLKRFTEEHPQLSIVIGASTFKEFIEGEPLSSSARRFSDYEGYYDAFNTVFLIDTNDISQWYHKSKLTPGVERMPFSKYLKFIEGLAIDLGGTVGSIGIDEERKVFETIYDTLGVSAIICYESVFGEFTAKFVRNGAQLIFIVTNDGWWGDTPGHRQHFEYARLRSIETRRSIARSANTGISAFINQRGDASQTTKYWEPAVIKENINANAEITFYVRSGDYIARIALFFSVLFLLISISIALMKKGKTGKINQ